LRLSGLMSFPFFCTHAPSSPTPFLASFWGRSLPDIPYQVPCTIPTLQSLDLPPNLVNGSNGCLNAVSYLLSGRSYSNFLKTLGEEAALLDRSSNFLCFISSLLNFYSLSNMVSRNGQLAPMPASIFEAPSIPQKNFCIFGQGILTSISPVIHTSAFEYHGLTHTYQVL
jgi:hypothetical protein